jgi:hypothetical protein
MADTPTTVVVTSLDGLNAAIQSANQGVARDSVSNQAVHTNNIIIDVGGILDAHDTDVLDLSAINNSNLNLTIEGNGSVLNGRDSIGGFTVFAGNVTITDLTIESTIAHGGDGGSGLAGGGGGAGLGGGVFVGSGATVTLLNDRFVANLAIGGDGGAVDSSATASGGGGGLGGVGGSAGDGTGIYQGIGGGGGGGIGAQAVNTIIPGPGSDGEYAYISSAGNYGTNTSLSNQAGYGAGQQQNVEQRINVLGWDVWTHSYTTTSGDLAGGAAGGQGGPGDSPESGGGGGGANGQNSNYYNDGTTQYVEDPIVQYILGALETIGGILVPPLGVAEAATQLSADLYNAITTNTWDPATIVGIVKDTGAITFAHADVDPTLKIDVSALPAGGGHFANPIVGFTGPDDVIDIIGLNFVAGATAVDDGSTLTFTDDGVTWTFDTPNATAFVDTVFDDGHGGTAIACYARGTLIATAQGEVAVEGLAIGDCVVTASGALRAIKWIGRRSYGGRFIMGRTDILPICFKAGSLGENVPKRDLWISPHHAMYFENGSGGMLVEAKDLVNGVSIVQAEQVDDVEYFHIELDTHDVIIAEGALSETFVDDDSRSMFHNAHEYRALYPGAVTIAQYCAPRLDRGYEVEAIRQRVALRAGVESKNETSRTGNLRGFVDRVTPDVIEGWAQNTDHPEAPVCLDIYAGDRLIGQVLANRYRADLERTGIGCGRHSFSFTPPPGLALNASTVAARRSLDGAILGVIAQARRSN